MPEPLRILVAESETKCARNARREREGRSSGESYLGTLRALAPEAGFELVRPVQSGDRPREALEAYDGVFLTGSPLHVYRETPEVRRQLDFMRALFESGTPAFGSCAGLQVAAAAAGGSVCPNRNGHELPFARRITPTPEGARHPLLNGRSSAYDALAVHSDEVERLPACATLLANNGTTAVQAAEIRYRGGVFWGVQYHPELPIAEVAEALRAQGPQVIRQGLARKQREVDRYADKLAALGRDPGRSDLAWQLGVDAQLTDPVQRTLELRNFLEALVKPIRSRRGRG